MTPRRASVAAPSEPVSIICRSTVPGEPAAKERPRFARNGRAYHSRDAVAGERNIAMQAMIDNPGIDPVDGDLGIRLRFYSAKTKRGGVKKSSDLDNLAKNVMDAYNGIVWTDDVQVVEINATIVRGDPDPRSEIEVYRIGESA